jgi:putative ABC transport system ATP-binding protein
MNVIRLEKIEKRFRNRLSTHEPTIALRLDAFEVTEGEQVALTGPSGCGKSTLLNLIAGILCPDSGGVVEVAGRRVDQLSPSEADRFRGQHIGYLFQEFNLISALTAMQNVMLGMRFGRTVPRIQWVYRAREMLDRVGLGHRRRHRPRELSIGEQQRVAIARALVNHPPIILADEPTGSLDPATGSQVFELLLDMCHEATHTLLVVTHDMSIADRLPRRFDCTGLIQESDDVQ